MVLMEYFWAKLDWSLQYILNAELSGLHYVDYKIELFFRNGCFDTLVPEMSFAAFVWPPSEFSV